MSDAIQGDEAKPRGPGVLSLAISVIWRTFLGAVIGIGFFFLAATLVEILRATTSWFGGVSAHGRSVISIMAATLPVVGFVAREVRRRHIWEWLEFVPITIGYVAGLFWIGWWQFH